MRLLFIFILFVVVEYLLRTFVEPYKFHALRPSLDYLPAMLLAVISAIYYRDVIKQRKFGWTYLKLFFVSVSGLIVKETILFFQWYWFIAPEYRTVSGDMYRGLGFGIANLLVVSFLVALIYLVACLTIKLINKRKVTTELTDRQLPLTASKCKRQEV